MSADITPQTPLDPAEALDGLCVSIAEWLKESEHASLDIVRKAYLQQCSHINPEITRIVWARAMRLYMEAA